jgi:hypothetical protein
MTSPTTSMKSRTMEASNPREGCTETCVTEVCGDGTINNAGTEAGNYRNNIIRYGCSAGGVGEFCGDNITNNIDEE